MEAAQGREVKYIKLYRSEGSSLGFSVVGLKSAHKGEPGIYVQEIQYNILKKERLIGSSATAGTVVTAR